MKNKLRVETEGRNIIIKEDGVVKLEPTSSEKIEEIRKKDSLCFDCANLYDCKKFIDGANKQTIDNYEFISEGAQVIDKNNAIEYFLVSKCKDFVNEEKNTKINRGKVITEFVTDYYGVDTLAEAEEKLKEAGVWDPEEENNNINRRKK